MKIIVPSPRLPSPPQRIIRGADELSRAVCPTSLLTIRVLQLGQVHSRRQAGGHRAIVMAGRLRRAWLTVQLCSPSWAEALRLALRAFAVCAIRQCPAGQPSATNSSSIPPNPVSPRGKRGTAALGDHAGKDLIVTVAGSGQLIFLSPSASVTGTPACPSRPQQGRLGAIRK